MSAKQTLTALAKRGVVAIGDAIAWAQVSWVATRTPRGEAIVVLDIDNTLADSWPSFLRPYRSHRDRLARLDVLPNVKEVAHDQPLLDGATILYLSHRNLWEWPVTYRWLGGHGFAVRPDRLVLVPDAASKLRHLRRLARHHRVTVWDDLSFGHETGSVTFYTDVIDALAGASLTYRGWDDIVTLSGKGLQRD